MIVGLGVELVETERFEAALDRFGERLHARLFTSAERAYAAGRARAAESLGVRFAAKVAARRALGDPRVRWTEVEVVRGARQAPRLALHGAAATAARTLGARHWNVTLSHDASWCVSQVVLEGSD